MAIKASIQFRLLRLLNEVDEILIEVLKIQSLKCRFY